MDVLQRLTIKKDQIARVKSNVKRVPPGINCGPVHIALHWQNDYFQDDQKKQPRLKREGVDFLPSDLHQQRSFPKMTNGMAIYPKPERLKLDES